MNKIDDKELETRLEDLWDKAEKKFKSEGGVKLEINKNTISAYLSKGIKDGKVAWILYNLGVNILQLDDNPDSENGARKFTYKEKSYNLLDEVGLRDFVQAKSQDINPLLNGDTTWVDTGGAGQGQPLTDKEKTLITDASLGTAEAKHAGAVLLAHLRAIKKAAHTSNNYQLDQKKDAEAGDSEDIDRDWTAKDTNQDVINSQITNPIATRHYQALEKYATVEKDTAKGLAWARANQEEDFGEIANKVWRKAQNLNNQSFIDQFKENHAGGNRTDREQIQLTVEKLVEIFGPENFNEEGKYIGGGSVEPKEYFLLDKITQEKIGQALIKLGNKWNRPTRKGLTSKILNKLLGKEKLVQGEKKWVPLSEPKEYEDLDEVLKGEKGYKIDEETAEETGLGISGKEIIETEEKFGKEEKGALLLEYFYKKAKYDEKDKFDIDNLDFCRVIENDDGEEELDTSGPGILPFGTGVGKTTKIINCLVRGGKRNVVLVCPTPGLVDSAFGHHKNWLQDWECVYHKETDNGEQILVGVVDKNGNPVLDEETGNQKKRRNMFITEIIYTLKMI